jgi:hypothetical protein
MKKSELISYNNQYYSWMLWGGSSACPACGDRFITNENAEHLHMLHRIEVNLHNIN